MAFAHVRDVRFVKSLLLAAAAAALTVATVVDRPRPVEGAASKTPLPVPDEETSVRVTHELVAAQAVSEPPPEPVRRPVARVSRLRAVKSPRPPPPPRAALARWFFGDGAHRPSPFPRPAERQRSTVR